ncbi:hypothetical protein ABPG74_020758 [Tetrahymena malaccensis]
MKTNILFATLTIQLLITRALDVLPIQINNDVLFIQEKNSVIYQASSDSTYRYSTLDAQGLIIATYLLSGLQKIDMNTRYFIQNNVLYLNYYQNKSYHTIDLNIMTSGQTGYLQTLQYPKAAKPCTTSEIIIQGIANFYYYMCFDSFNIFLLQSSTFQGIFNTQNSYSSIPNGGIRNEYTHIVLDNKLFTNGTIYQIQISFAQTLNIVLVSMPYNLYLIEDYLTKVSTTNSIFKDITSVKLNNPSNIDQVLISDVINFPSKSIIAAYDFKKKAFRYFDAQNLQELLSTGVALPFINYKTFLQYQNSIFIGTSQYTLTYDPSSNKVNIALSPNTLSNSYTLPYYHIIYYAFSYSLTYQVFSGSNQYLINISQAYNFCVPGCQTCSSITACAVCLSPLYLDNQFQCVSACPTQFFPDNSNTNCICRPNSTLLNQSCPCNSTYIDLNGNCVPCPQNCSTCTSQTICSVCQAGYYVAADGTCVSTCPLDFIPDQTNTNCVCRQNSTLSNLQCPCNTGYIDISDVCQQCPLNCDVCTSQSVCSQCSQNYYLTVQGSCTSSCPQTFVVDSTQKQCVCDANRTLQNNLCPCNSSYVDISGVCKPCSSNCDQCNSQTSCTVCQQNYYLTADMTCVATCPQTFVVNVNQTQCICDVNRTLTNNMCPCNSGFLDINGICQQCPQNCNTCSSQTICTACQTGYYLTLDGSCTQSCPLTFTVDSTKTKCVCDINRTLQNNSCPCNTAFVDIGGTCKPCPQNCQTCTSQTTCQVCQAGFYQTVNNTCVSQCPNTFIVDVQQNKCVCAINQSLSNNQCITCQDGCIKCTSPTNCQQYSNCGAQFKYDFLSQKCVQCLWDVQAQKCVNNCTNNQIYDSQKQLCQQCYYYNSQCQSSCPIGYYSDNNFQCQQCSPQCKTCNGPNINQCTSCNYPLYLQDDNTCSICELGQFLDKQQNICKTCNINCLTCNGPNKNNCLSCVKDQVLSKDTSECLTQSQVETQIQNDQKIEYSNCDQTNIDCPSLLALSDLIQKILLGIFAAIIASLIFFLIFCSSNGLLGWYCIQIFQLIGNLAFNKNMNIFWLNIGTLKNFLAYNLLNLVTSNPFQNGNDIQIEFNKYGIGIQIQDLYQNVIQNCFYHLIGLALLLFLMLKTYFLKNQSGMFKRVHEYIILNGLIRYFMITSNFILVCIFNSIKLQNYTEKGNIYIIGIFGLIYLSLYTFITVSILVGSQNLSQAIYVTQLNLLQYKRIYQFFWCFFEVRKIACILIMIFFDDFKFNGIIISVMNLIFLVYIIISKPTETNQQLIVISLSEIILIALFIMFEFISNRKELGINPQLATYLALCFVISTIILSIIFIIVFCLSLYQQLQNYFQNKNIQKIKKQNQQPIVQQFQIFNSLTDIQTVLASSLQNSKIKWQKYPSKKR